MKKKSKKIIIKTIKIPGKTVIKISKKLFNVYKPLCNKNKWIDSRYESVKL